MIRKGFLVVIILVLAALIVVSSGCGAPAVDKAKWPPLSNAGPPMGGTYSYVATAMGEMWKKYLGIDVPYAPIGSGTAQTNALIKRETQLANMQGENVPDAIQGRGLFEQKLDARILTISSNYGRAIITRGDANIKTIADLKGKRGMLSSPGSPMYDWVMEILFRVNGMTYNRAEPTKTTDCIIGQYVGSKDAKEAFLAGQTDAWLYPVGSVGLSAHMIELSNTLPCNFISLTGEEFSAIDKEIPFINPFTVPAGTYKGQSQPVIMFGTTFSVAIMTEAPDDLAYELVKVLWEHQAEFNEYFPDCKDYSLERTLRYDLWNYPLHNGVVLYIKDKGLWTDEHEAKQKELLNLVGASK